MLQRINQNFNQSEKIADNFGNLPWENKPGFWARLLGENAFTIDYENIIIHKTKNDIKISFDEMEAIECQKKIIYIKTTNNGDFSFKAGEKSSDIANLIFRLANELNEFKSFMKVEKVLPQIGFAYFIKAFAYRGNPYKRAIDILMKTQKDSSFPYIIFEPDKDSVKVSYRLNEKNRFCFELSKFKYENFINQAKNLAGCNAEIINEPQKGSFKFNDSAIWLYFYPSESGEITAFEI